MCRKNFSTRTPLRVRCRSNARMSSKRFFQMSLPTSCSGNLLPQQHFRMHAHHQHLLVMGAVEDADMSALRQPLGGAPEEIMCEFLVARRLERMDLAALRIDGAHHVLDDAVLAGRVHALQHDQHRPAAVRVEPLLQFTQPLDVLRQHRLAALLVMSDAAGVGGVDSRRDETCPDRRCGAILRSLPDVMMRACSRSR